MFAAAKQTEIDIAAANEALAKAEADRKANKQAQGQQTGSFWSGTTVLGLAIGLVLAVVMGRKLQGKTASEAVEIILEMFNDAIRFVYKVLSDVFKRAYKGKDKKFPE